ncbi:lipoprotein insertase outer membrane protein LolB [Endozoicomonas sp. ONNA2]|uniref:lipoprotein insertase outer membrane protein LolB n=1 Tax=Endozoicomonas sp. ONNA2 TaxID=2828741 RepID=UPI00214803A5|nr:lipoprotein insertase outer membrane protein LolB [Endozoicomonas sp. ONNA2]
MGVDNYFSGLRILLILFFFFLGGCASQTVDSDRQVSDQEKEQRWQRHQKRLGLIQAWEIAGRLNMKVPGQSGTVSFHWRQRGDKYKLTLDGPFGASVARISGDGQSVSVSASDQTRYGPSPEILLYSLTGWQFPVSNLRYWVRGLPAPGNDARIQLNNLGYPEKIEQQGWVVAYQQYGLSNSQRLPVRFVVSRGGIRLSLMVSSWQL